MRRAALALAREAERRHELATTAWWKEERDGVFIDFNQNAWDKTIASAYSVRHTGYVSTPFRWDELAALDHTRFDLMSFKDRWEEVGDLTDGIDEAACRLELVLEMVAADEERGLGDAPWPPHYPKMPGEPPRVQPAWTFAPAWKRYWTCRQVTRNWCPPVWPCISPIRAWPRFSFLVLVSGTSTASCLAIWWDL